VNQKRLSGFTETKFRPNDNDLPPDQADPHGPRFQTGSSAFLALGPKAAWFEGVVPCHFRRRWQNFWLVGQYGPGIVDRRMWRLGKKKKDFTLFKQGGHLQSALSFPMDEILGKNRKRWQRFIEIHRPSVGVKCVFLKG